MPSVEAIRGSLFPFAASVILVAGGLAALAGGVLSSRSRTLLLSAGSLGVLYGTRLWATTQASRLLLDATPQFWSYLIVDLTYLINAPFALFLALLVGGRWWNIFRWVAGILAAYAVVAIAIDAVAGPGTASGPNGYLVVGAQILCAWSLLRPGVPVTRELRMVRRAFAVLVVFILNENAPILGIPSARRIEWIGVTIFLAGLGYAAALRVFEGERQVAALTQEMETARRLQASILPRLLPRLKGASLAARYEPMTAVAGDLYDVVVRGTGLGILVADVAGHGVAAALIASMVKVAFALQASHPDDPGRVLAEMNRALCRSQEGSLVTAACAWIDLDSLKLAYAAAGHPPLLLRGVNGVEQIAENGIVMGLVDGAEYSVTRRDLAPGDRLLFYTDGAIEARSPKGEEFTLDGLAALVEGSRDSADEFVDTILRRLAAWRGGAHANDDLTLVVLDIDEAAR